MKMSDPKQDQNDGIAAARALGRVVDFRIPLPWILGGVLAVIWALISMWFSLQQIRTDMTDMKTALTAAVATNSRVQLLEFRIQTLEADMASMKGRR